MNITKDNAKLQINDYINFGNASHFKYKGQAITGFLFTRKELNDLFKDNVYKELFLMLALGRDNSTPSKKYLNLVVGSIFNCWIETDNLVVSTEPYTDTTSFTENIVKSLFGDEIPVEELRSMQNNFTSSNVDEHLTSTQGIKVKGYHLDGSDLTDLLLRTTVNTSNANDLFIFMPVIRSGRLVPPYDRPYLSIAVARFDLVNKKVVDKIIEYCLPCPNACPSNYPIQ